MTVEQNVPTRSLAQGRGFKTKGQEIKISLVIYSFNMESLKHTTFNLMLFLLKRIRMKYLINYVGDTGL